MGGARDRVPLTASAGTSPADTLASGFQPRWYICHVRKFYLSISYDVVSGPGGHTQFQTTRRQESWEMLLISRGGGPKLSPGKGGRAGGSGPGAVARCWVGPAAEQGGCAACSLSGLQRRGACGHTRRRKEGGRFKPSSKWGD